MTARAEIAEARGDGDFDSTTPEPVLDKLREEIDELRAELTAGVDHARLQDGIGDVLFVGVNLA